MPYCYHNTTQQMSESFRNTHAHEIQTNDTRHQVKNGRQGKTKVDFLYNINKLNKSHKLSKLAKVSSLATDMTTGPT